MRRSSALPFTGAILATILFYTWLLEPRGVPVLIPATIVLVLALWSAWRSRMWGVSAAALWPALRATVLFTVPAILGVLGAGAALGTLHARESLARDFLVLIPWGGAQQFVLHTVVLREAQRLTSRNKAIIVAAFLFAIVHLPNPFLTVMTFVGALAWCTIFSRYPNIIPLGVSHALATLAILCAFDDHLTGRLRIGHAYLMLMR